MMNADADASPTISQQLPGNMEMHNRRISMMNDDSGSGVSEGCGILGDVCEITNNLTKKAAESMENLLW